MENYQVIVFKNKVKKRVLKKFVTYKKAKQYFNQLIDNSNDVWFEVKNEYGEVSDYELCIIERDTNRLFPVYVTDELGRNLVVELEDNEWNIVNISKYKIDEEIYDCQTKNRIKINYFIKKYLGKDGLKLLSKLNNKIVVQKDEETFLFSLKNEKDSKRLLESLEKRFIDLKRADVMIAYDFSNSSRKYIYKILEDKGFDKQFLYRKYTTHPSSKYK
jgi:hypothetical protein